MNTRSLTPLLFSLAVAATTVLVASRPHAQTPPAPAPAPAPSGKPQLIDTSKPFAHDTHLDAKKVEKPLRCESCHQVVTPEGACPKAEVRFPSHEACASCHAASFYTPPLTICTTCHLNAAFQKDNPLRPLERQVTPRRAEFSHKSHATGKSADCTSCHQFQKGGKSVSHPSHASCCECHTASSPAEKPVAPKMSECSACHTLGKFGGRPSSKIHEFSHKLHNTDPRTQASTTCKQCHVNVTSAATLRQLAAPPMATCVECHDGSDPNLPHPKNPQWHGTGAFHFSTCLRCHVAGKIESKPLPPSHPKEPAAAGTGAPP